MNEVFKWDIDNHYWYLFDGPTGQYCYVHQITAPPIPGTQERASTMPYIYTVVQALIEENGTWTLKATPFSNVYEALEYSESVLGYMPKFRDPNAEIYYKTKKESV